MNEWFPALIAGLVLIHTIAKTAFQEALIASLAFVFFFYCIHKH